MEENKTSSLETNKFQLQTFCNRHFLWGHIHGREIVKIRKIFHAQVSLKTMLQCRQRDRNISMNNKLLRGLKKTFHTRPTREKKQMSFSE